MASSTEIAKRYFEALAAHDLDAAVALWEPGATDRFVSQQELTAPEGVRTYFTELFAAFPDFSLEVLDVTSARNRTAVRWRGSGTFAGPGTFQGFTANGARIEIEGCDVVTVSEGKIQHNDAYIDGADLARQLGFMPAAGSKAEARLTKLANARTKVRSLVHGAQPERIADGVSVIRGGFPLKTMNVYLIDEDDGVTMFDAGISGMTDAIRIVGVRAGAIKRIVLGYADADHRGAAPGLGVPGHAPGLIGLFRESDRLALVSDCFYTRDPLTGRKGAARIPHPAFDADIAQVRASIRKLAALNPSVAWPGHANTVEGNVATELKRAAAAPV